MSQSFSLSKSECSPISDPSLRTEIFRHTGNEGETTRILRSLERFGGDASIVRYDITPRENGRFAQRVRTVAWSVRAVRRSTGG